VTRKQQHLYTTSPASSGGAAGALGGEEDESAAGEPEQQEQLSKLAKDVSATLFMPIWDAFFDATLDDYLEYLQAAAAGAPSVFLPRGLDSEMDAAAEGIDTIGVGRSAVADQAEQQQQQQQQEPSIGEAGGQSLESEDSGEVLAGAQAEDDEYVICLNRLEIAIRVLSCLSSEQRRRPLLLIGMTDVQAIAAVATVKPEDVLGVLGDFYMFKRLGMYMAMEALQQR
jgi:hypothetical protein